VFEEHGQEVTKSFEFRLINENSEGEAEIRGTPTVNGKL
jgi:hypothetical protein